MALPVEPGTELDSIENARAKIWRLIGRQRFDRDRFYLRLFGWNHRGLIFRVVSQRLRELR